MFEISREINSTFPCPDSIFVLISLNKLDPRPNEEIFTSLILLLLRIKLMIADWSSLPTCLPNPENVVK